jgi:predicted DNA-binding transcriptional regulator AlpA
MKPPPAVPFIAAVDGAPKHTNGLGQLLTAEQLAERWQISTAQVYRLARGGAIPCVPLGRYKRFRLASIEAWEAAQEVVTDE